MNEKNQITEGVIWKQLLLFFFPVVAGTFLQQIYNAADTIVVGRFVGKEALAAVGGSVNQIVNLIVEVFVGLTSGASVIVSQFYGARDKRIWRRPFIQYMPWLWRRGSSSGSWAFFYPEPYLNV